MAILATGGAGFIGSHTCLELLNAGYEVVVIDSLVNSSEESLRRVQELTGKTLRFYKGDTRDAALLDTIFTENEIEAVVHFAALKSVPESVKMPLEYYDNNLTGTIELLKAMRRNGCKKIVFSSSATVYGAENKCPFTEDMKTGTTTNPYGTTKLQIERIMTDTAAADPDWHVVLLRYFNPIGAHASGRIGEAPGYPNNLMPYITQVAVGKREKLTVFGNNYPTPDGTGVRDYIHVVDLAKGHVKAIAFVLDHAGTEVFNLGTGNGTSVLELIHAFEEVTGVTVPYEIGPARTGDVAYSYANADKAKRVLGWQAELDVRQMCRDAWNWQKNNPNGYE